MKNIIKIIVFFNLVVATFVGFTCVAIYQFNRSLETKVNPDLYEEVISQRQNNSEYYSFFPKTIPSLAYDSVFYHVPGFLQGGDTVILRVKLPKSEFKKYSSRVNGLNPIDSERVNEMLGPRPYIDWGIKEANEDNHFNLMDNLPKHFKVYLFRELRENKIPVRLRR